jgi:hypothetical protein
LTFAESIKNYSGQPLTRQVLLDLLKDYQRPYDKISELTRQKMLIQVKRGLFIPGPVTSVEVPEALLLANHLWGPSYVSSDSALAYWGLIPERVYETISMTTHLAKTYQTPVGRFRYIRLPLPYYAFGLKSMSLTPSQTCLIAGKEKALCDKVITTQRLKLRSVKQAKQYLMEDLRIEREDLRTFDTQEIEDYLLNAPKRDSLSILIKTLSDL